MPLRDLALGGDCGALPGCRKKFVVV